MKQIHSLLYWIPLLGMILAVAWEANRFARALGAHFGFYCLYHIFTSLITACTLTVVLHP